MAWDPTAKMTKAEIRAYFTREIGRLHEEIVRVRKVADEGYARAYEAEGKLEEKAEELKAEDTICALYNLVCVFEDHVSIPDMTEYEFETVRTARVFARDTIAPAGKVQTYGDRGPLEGLV